MDLLMNLPNGQQLMVEFDSSSSAAQVRIVTYPSEEFELTGKSLLAHIKTHGMLILRLVI